ncbi:MAG: hypothetical protein AAFV19_21325 [Pseudomonadota bacterium]
MSDPALTGCVDPEDFMPLMDMPRDPDAVYLFDFDGVIAAGIEDHIYKLDEKPGEHTTLTEIEHHLGLRIGDMEFRYRRHLVFQELALRLQVPIAPGAGYAAAKWASDNARFFVLTARSGWAATARVRVFLETNGLTPIDLYQVGRVHKDRQVLRTLEEFPGSRVYYIEDSPPHLAKAAALNSQRLSTVFCEAEADPAEVSSLYDKVFEQGGRHVRSQNG